MQPIRLLQAMLLILSLLKALGLITGAESKAIGSLDNSEAAYTHYLSTSVMAGVSLAFAPRSVAPQSIAPPPPPENALPAELVATWYTGALPLMDFYDPLTGAWRAQNGLGETYTFDANGNYSYAGFLRLQNGLCLTEVSTYRGGKAQAANGTLTLTPSAAKTHTVIHCGSSSETTTDGPFDAATLTYEIGTGTDGRAQLTLTGNGSSTLLARHESMETLAENAGNGMKIMGGL